jgi:hypothetical protein
VRPSQYPLAVEGYPRSIDLRPLLLDFSFVEEERGRHVDVFQVTIKFFAETRFINSPASEKTPGTWLVLIGGMGR